MKKIFRICFSLIALVYVSKALIISKLDPADYCNIKKCVPATHTMCVFYVSEIKYLAVK